MTNNLEDYFSIAGGKLPDIVDLRDLEAPEPMETILTACAQLGADEVYLARLPHVPGPLFPLLKARRLIWQLHAEAENSVLILIGRKS